MEHADPRRHPPAALCRQAPAVASMGDMPTVTWMEPTVNWMEPNGWMLKPRAKPRAKPRGRNATDRRDTCKAPLHDSVELTPGGHRKHTLTRTSPGGTTRSTQYASPRKGDEGVWGGDFFGEILRSADEVECEQYVRRVEALNEVPGRQTAAQRSACARAKRKAGVPAAPRAKRAVFSEREREQSSLPSAEPP